MQGGAEVENISQQRETGLEVKQLRAVKEKHFVTLQPFFKCLSNA